MSLTADIADAIIALDQKLARYELALRRVSFETGDDIGTPLEDMTEWVELKEAIEGLQETACGEGMHFESADEARRFRDVRDHGFVADTDEPGCDFMYGESFRCGKTPKQHVV